MNTEQARINMIKQQLRPMGVVDEAILHFFGTIPREHFVPLAYKKLAFADIEIPLPHNQVMLAPKVQGMLLQQVAIKPHDRVLEIGTGSGFLTAILAALAEHVVSVDIFSDFTAMSRANLNACTSASVELQTGNAAFGWRTHEFFDVVIITGALLTLPDSFKKQLNMGGRLFAFVGQAPVMEAICLTRKDQNTWEKKLCFETFTPPLIDSPIAESFIF